MYVAQKKRKENIAEYILYLFRVEDIVRACQKESDSSSLREYIFSAYDGEEQVLEEVAEWYRKIEEEMRERGLMQYGHIERIERLLSELNTFHNALLKMPLHSLYASVYYKALPIIIQLRERAGERVPSEIETCFVGIYGLLQLKMKGEEVSKETVEGLKTVSTFLAMLADRYREYEEGNLHVDFDTQSSIKQRD